MTNMDGLRQEEAAALELLSECWSLADELDGIDLGRFRAGIEQLQDQVFALLGRRLYLKTQSRPTDV